jgi:hypothetical protein
VKLASTIIPGLADCSDEEVNLLYQRRQLLDFFLDLEGNSGDSDVERLELRLQFSSTLVDFKHFESSLLFATAEESIRLHRLLLECDVTPPPNLKNKPSILLPYWGHYHALGGVAVITDDFRHLGEVKVIPYRYTWFGLTQKRCGCESLDVFPTYLDAIAASKPNTGTQRRNPGWISAWCSRSRAAVSIAMRARRLIARDPIAGSGGEALRSDNRSA